MKVSRIEINFPCPVGFPPGFEQTLSALVGMACNAYEKENPTRSMWPSGIGSKPTYIPMTQEEEKERGMEFDDSVFCIDVCERQAHDRELKRRSAQPVVVNEE